MTDATRRTLVQTTIALATTMPALVQASGISETLPWVAGALAIAGGLSHVMALPGVQTFMPAWLRTEPSVDDELLALRRKEDATE
ncbi:hypothetical protein OG453_38135 [Streptomyces sp. NBC_01381]|uniref:hypothetical protein n=1 Tax=Streptomyces sp. NBC_01381 TaxID=2903845 RepID=UPI00225397EF|nr:hypothetical protein [Streptomyces sp. NBC_01381]MCX4672411.1 hypothetical protein [Streptomyces sp. NBC_01381]